MTLPVVGERLAHQYAQTLVGKSGRPSEARVLALRAQPSWTGPDELQVEGGAGVRSVRVQACPSPLAVYEAVVERDPDDYLLVLTDVADSELGLEVLGRCFNQMLVPVDLWGGVAMAFGARAIEPALRKESWAQDALLSRAPAAGWPVAVTGTVTKDHALTHLTAALLGIAPDQVEPAGLLLWTLDAHATEGWRAQPDAVRAGIRSWVKAAHGEVAELALRIASQGHSVDGVSFGIVADVLYGEQPATSSLLEARVRLEQFTGYVGLPDRTGRAWADTALALLLRMSEDVDNARRAAVLARASAAFDDLRWPEGAQQSSVLDAGYVQRLRSLAASLGAAVAVPTTLPDVESAFVALLAHEQAPRDRRTTIARMAVRLARWLATGADEVPSTLVQALDRHCTSDAWVDRAASAVWVGSSDPDVATAYSVLVDAVRQRRCSHDKVTAHLLADVTSGGVLPAGLTPVERLVADVVLPLASNAPVLLVVVDGMSAGVAAAVTDDALAQDWFEAVPRESGRRTGVLAVLPTLTRFSRTSLFAGELRDGQQAVEKTAFAGISNGGVVFHKSDLVGPAGEELPAAVREAVSSSTSVVAVVLNTVDDALSKADPGGTSWDLASMRHLQPLLELAAVSGRRVVMTSDHGHVVERGSQVRSYDGAEARFRPATSGPADPDTEVLLTGPRVLAADGAIVAPFVEDLRYGGKQAGYHGGASAAEVVIPVVVLARQPDVLEGTGWAPAAPQAPAWWNDPVAVAEAAHPAAAPVPTKRKQEQVPGQESLLPEEAPPASAPAAASVAVVAALLASPTYAQQKSRVGARAVPDDRVAAIVTALLDHHGRLHRDTLAGLTGIPTPRIGSTLTALRRQLNVEGYEVVAVDPDQVTVVLDSSLLREQFDLGAV